MKLLVILIISALSMIYLYFLNKKKLFKELVLSLCIFLVVVLYSYSYLERWDLPVPATILDTLLSPISKFVFDMNK